MQVWKMPSEGGQALQVTKKGGFVSQESPDGKFLYFAKGRGAAGVWRVPVGGGEEVPVLEQVRAGYERFWAVREKGIYFAYPGEPHHPAIGFFNFSTRRIIPLANLEKDLPPNYGTLAISPDGRWILYSQIDHQGSDIALVENFR